MHKEMSTRFHCRASSNSTMQKLCIFKGGYKQIHVVARQVKEQQNLHINNWIVFGEVKLVSHPRKFPEYKFYLQIPKSPDLLVLTTMVNGTCPIFVFKSTSFSLYVWSLRTFLMCAAHPAISMKDDKITVTGDNLHISINSLCLLTKR